MAGKTYTFTFDGEDLSLTIKNFMLFWKFSIDSQRTVQAETPYFSVLYSRKSFSELIKRPDFQEEYKNITIKGSDGIKFEINGAQLKDSIKWEYRNETHQLYLFEAADTSNTKPKDWFIFNDNKPNFNLDVPATNNKATILHEVEISKTRQVYTVIEKEDDKGSSAIAFVLPLHQTPLVADILEVANVDNTDGAVSLKPIKLKRKLLKAKQGCVTKEGSSTLFPDNYNANLDAKGFSIIAQGKFKNIQLNFYDLMEWLNINIEDNCDSLMKHLSLSVQGDRCRSLSSAQNDKDYSVVEGSTSLPVEMVFIDDINSTFQQEVYISPVEKPAND